MVGYSSHTYTPEWMRLKPAESSSPLYFNYTRSLQTNKGRGRLISSDLSAQARLFVNTDNQSWVFLMVVLIDKTALSSFTYMWTTLRVHHVTLWAWTGSRRQVQRWIFFHTSSEWAWRHLKLNILIHTSLWIKDLFLPVPTDGPEPDTKSSLLSCQRGFQ